MITLMICSPILEKRFDKIKHHCMKTFKKPDNVTWDEVTLIQMLVVSENYLIKGLDLIHEGELKP